MEKVKAHVSEKKKNKVKMLAELMKKRTVMVVSIKGLPAAQFQDIKKKLRGRAQIVVSKKSLIDFALEHCGIKELGELVPYVQDSTAILFSDEDAFEISALLAKEKSPAKAKEGQVAPEDLVVKAGPTELAPGPDISALSAVGLQPKVENGKISIMQDKVLCKKGEVISQEKASILAKLDIVPFEVGVEPIAAYMDGKVYAEIKIDVEETVEKLVEAYSRSLAFAVELAYPSKESIDFILAKASAEEAVLKRIITGEPEPVAVEAPKEEKEETKPEEPKQESTAGLASLFG